MLHRAARLFHTVRWLRPQQVAGRVWRQMYRPRVDTSSAPPVRGNDSPWSLNAWRAPSLSDATTLRIHDIDCDLSTAGSWNYPSRDKLFLYHLHYFDDLTAREVRQRSNWHEALLARWIAENPPGSGNGWEPYPLSLRIVNWIIWALRGESLAAGAIHNLAIQARYLRAQLEHHLLGNHLWANAKALVFAGVYFDGDEARRWRECGLHLLRRELGEQILADGGHFERSPMYHATVLQDLLDLIALAQSHPETVPDADVAKWRATVPGMVRWLAIMTHPDGDIALFNDAAFEVAPRLRDLVAGADALDIAVDVALGEPLYMLADSGYARLQKGEAVLIADVGLVGPDYLPGHAHADTLSFELSLHGRRVIVDAGTSRYDLSPQRLWQRGTAAHNTIQVDGEDSSEVWSSFRVARRARVHDLSWGVDEAGVWLCAAHDGYRRLRGRVGHLRRWRLRPRGLDIRDVVDGRFDSAVARLRFAPGLEPALTSSGEAEVPECAMRLAWPSAAVQWARVAPGTWHPRFGCSESCKVLELAIREGVLTTELRWK